MKTKERLIDLSDIKDDDLDKTASFTDLMSRSERKKREKAKKKKDDLDKIVVDENNNILIKNEIEKISEVESIEEALSQTKKYEELTQTLNKDIKLEEEKKDEKNNYDDFDLDDKRFGSGLLISNILLLIVSLGLIIYFVMFTDNLNRRKFLYIDSALLAGMFFLFGISLIGNRKFSKFISIINILVFISFIIFNSLIILKYIK